MSAWHITCKDLMVLSHDKRALVLLLVLPLMFIGIVGMSTGQFLTRDDDNEKLKVVFVDQNQTETSRNLFKGLQHQHEIVVTEESTEDAAFDALRRGDASLILVVGKTFEERVEELRMSDIFDPTNGLIAMGSQSIDVTLATKPNGAVLGKLLESVMFSQIVRFVIPIAARKSPVTRGWVRSHDTNENDVVAESRPHVSAEKPSEASAVFGWVVPGFTVMFAFFLISIMARSFILERDQGTLQRLRLAPIGVVPVLLGKTIPFYLTSVFQCSMLFLCGRALFGMPWGPQPLYLIPVILCTSAAATSLGLLLSTVVRTDQQVSSYGTTLILVLSSVSGCFFPREMFPSMMKQISLFTPHAWALKAFDGVLSQPSVDPRMIATCCCVLLLFATLFFATGIWRFQSSQ